MIEKEFYEGMYGKGVSTPARHKPISKLRRKLALDRLEISYGLLETGERFIDLGCGTGALVFQAANKYQSCYGTDIVSSSVAKTKKEAESRTDKERFNFLEANLNLPLPFPDSYFDAVTCISVLAHLFNPYALVKESYRVLKKGGIFIVQVPNLAYIKYRLVLLSGRLPQQSNQIGWDGGILHYFTLNSLCQLIEEEGFKVEKKTCSGVLIPLRRLWLSLLGADIILKARKV